MLEISLKKIIKEKEQKCFFEPLKVDNLSQSPHVPSSTTCVVHRLSKGNL